MYEFEIMTTDDFVNRVELLATMYSLDKQIYMPCEKAIRDVFVEEFPTLFRRRSTLGNVYIINVVTCCTDTSADTIKKYLPVYLFINGNMYYVNCEDCYDNAISFHSQKID